VHHLCRKPYQFSRALENPSGVGPRARTDLS
jgi:hypothetical protein